MVGFILVVLASGMALGFIPGLFIGFKHGFKERSRQQDPYDR